MSDVLLEFGRVEEARSNAALQLVTYKWASLAIAVFRTSFGDQQRTVPSERLQLRVDSFIEDLSDRGFQVPDQDGKSLCREWTNRQWLRRLALDDGTVYELTSSAFQAMRVIDSLGSQTTMLSESRLTMIIDAMRRAATAADPDRASRVAALQEQVDLMTRERDELLAGAEVRVASNEQMLMQYRDISDLLAQLPGDFRRVEESIADIRQAMVQGFREDLRPRGEVLGEYLEASEHLMQKTEAGRAFMTASEMLRDEKVLDDFRADAQTILRHPFAAPDLMTQRERRVLSSADQVLRDGLSVVQEQQHQASRSLTEYLESHDAGVDRELVQVLAALDRAIGAWMVDARVRAAVPMPWMPAALDIDHLPSRWPTAGGVCSLEALAPIDSMTAPIADVDDWRRSGGPRTEVLIPKVEQLLRSGAASSVAGAFGQLSAEDRRPVELWGLAQWALDEDLWAPAAVKGSESVTAIRPNGVERQLLFPHVGHGKETCDE